MTKRELFQVSDETKELKRLLKDFISNIKIKSDLPKVVLRIDNLRVKIGVTHNYKGAEYSLFLLYGELLQEKEVMENVRDFFMQCSRKLDELTSHNTIPEGEVQ